MPLGPIDVRPIRTDLLNEIYEKMDKKIREEYTEGDSSIYIIFRDECLSIKEIDTIETAYKEAGWSGFNYSTSAEHGERPGLIMICLYKKGE